MNLQLILVNIFSSLLDILARNLFDKSIVISFRELMIEMLANAWYPHNFFKLSFGSQDQIAKKLDNLGLWGDNKDISIMPS